MTYVLPVRFGASVRKGVAETTENMYEKLVPDYLHLGGDPTVLDVLWVSDAIKIARQSSKLLFTRSLKELDREKALVIDIGGPNYGSCTDPEFFLGLIDFLSDDFATSSFSHVFVVSPELRHELDHDYTLIQKACEDLQVNFIFLKNPAFGRAWANLLDKGLTLETLSNFYTSTQASVGESIKMKIVRHVGRFSFSEGSPIYPYYYDFTECHPELVRAVEEFLSDHQSSVSGKKFRIYYDCTTRDWFRDAVEEAIGSLQLNDDAVPIENYAERIRFTTNSVLLTPIIRSGNSLERLLTSTQNIPRVWALANIFNPQDADEKSRAVAVSVGGAKKVVSVNFTIALEESKPDLFTVWNSVLGDHEGIDVDLAADFSAPAMWAMVLSAGFARERYGPDDRPKINVIPDFERMVFENLSLLGRKLEAACTETLGNPLPERMAFLCVDEPCVKRLADHMSRGEIDRYLFVTRPLMNEMSKYPDRVHFFEECKDENLLREAEEFLDTIKRLSEITSIVDSLGAPLAGSAEPLERLRMVGFDEFVYSGSTVELMKDFCQKMTTNLVLHVSIASLADYEKPGPPALRSFYHFGFPKRKANAG